MYHIYIQGVPENLLKAWTSTLLFLELVHFFLEFMTRFKKKYSIENEKDKLEMKIQSQLSMCRHPVTDSKCVQ